MTTKQQSEAMKLLKRRLNEYEKLMPGLVICQCSWCLRARALLKEMKRPDSTAAEIEAKEKQK